MKTDSATPGYDWHGVLQLVLRHRRELVAAHVIAVLAVLASVPLPLMLPLLVDEVLLDKPGVMVGWMNGLFPAAWHGPVLYITSILAATVALRFVSVLLNVWQTRQFSLIAKDVVFVIRRDLLQRLRRISMSEYETRGSGAVSSYFVTDLNAVDNFIAMAVAKFLIAVLSLVGVTVVLLWLHWQLALLILFLNPLVIYFSVKLGTRVKHLKKRENQAFEQFQGALTETLDAIQQIRAANREQHYLQRVVDRAARVRSDSAAFSWKSDAASRLSFFVFLFGFDVFRATSMLMVVYSDLTIGQMMAVFAYLWYMMTPVQDILGIQYAYYGARAALERINSFLGLREEPEYAGRDNPFAGKRGVRVQMDDLLFSYRDEEPILDGISLDIAPGERVALVGASGGGKSTLVQALLGLYQPTGGTIRFDGVPVENIGLNVVREHVATVLQHPAIFNDSVRGNLTFGREYEDAQLWKALEQAQLAEVVRELPGQLDAELGRQGVRLSGGQRQRLAIARLLLSDPQLVILDEATSALDTETESRLLDALEAFLAGRTVLIIAHRLSAVRRADRVLVFEAGRIVEQGRHGELIEAGGLYSRLYA